MFNYGSFKLFLSKISIGVVLICFSSFLIISILTNSPNDPGIRNLSGNKEIYNLLGFWGAVSSSFFLILFGRLSLVFIIFLFYLGFLLSFGIKSKKYFLKLLLVIMSSALVGFTAVLNELEFFNKGIIQNILFDIFSYYFPLVINTFLYKFIFSFLVIVISFFF